MAEYNVHQWRRPSTRMTDMLSFRPSMQAIAGRSGTFCKGHAAFLASLAIRSTPRLSAITIAGLSVMLVCFSLQSKEPRWQARVGVERQIVSGARSLQSFLSRARLVPGHQTYAAWQELENIAGSSLEVRWVVDDVHISQVEVNPSSQMPQTLIGGRATSQPMRHFGIRNLAYLSTRQFHYPQWHRPPISVPFQGLGPYGHQQVQPPQP
jgi:hypothetical protein